MSAAKPVLPIGTMVRYLGDTTNCRDIYPGKTGRLAAIASYGGMFDGRWLLQWGIYRYYYIIWQGETERATFPVLDCEIEPAD